jgi:putative ubiquitin-RnfH superfamily antitoxin RatB of RatAB toxin-antitoxin module
VLYCELELSETATVADALAVARARLGEVIDWEHAAVGVYGRLCTREQVPADGDRIELYRALRVDPRAARRARVARLRTVRDT